ncbi:zf-HC2 domain-containing protein [Myxococcota bacterium]|nr:zf-HC2 domain-containing protein [Myxococcota bacterium]
MIRCRDVVDLLDRLVERHGLTGETLARMDLHLHDCPPCREFVHSYRHMLEGARLVPPPELPPEVALRILDAVRTEIARDPHPAEGPQG